MPLWIVATPIGNPQDISSRAVQVLKQAEVIIGEEHKELRRLLKQHDIIPPQIEICNEHSTPKEIEELASLCKDKKVALVSDCGTPVFCDPGTELIRACRQQGAVITAVPGASSLMTILALSSRPLDEFIFKGFLPAKTEPRAKEIKAIARDNRPVVLMDTPYRLDRLLDELAAAYPERLALIGLDLTLESELVIEANLKEIRRRLQKRKAEFILIIYPAVKR